MSYYNENIHSLRSSKDDSLISSPRSGADEYILLLERLNSLNSNKAIKNKSKNKESFYFACLQNKLFCPVNF